MKNECILVTGANGQIGSELVEALMRAYGESSVIASDVAKPSSRGPARFEVLDVLDRQSLGRIVQRHRVSQIWHLAARLSAAAEQLPLPAWNLNVDGLWNVLEAARERKLARVFWPSSIAAFGPASPRRNAPQLAVMNPSTIYGVSKVSGELLCAYFHAKYGLDARSLRYPGVISHKSPPGGGTTDYAIEMFQAAKRGTGYECFLASDTALPMLYMPDAIRGALELMSAAAASITVRSSYNVAGVSFSPSELAEEIRKRVPGFKVRYRPDFRQAIAQSWPQSIDDSVARRDWTWKLRFGLAEIVEDMLAHVPREWPRTRLQAHAA